MLDSAHLRIARATDHLNEIIRFYRDGLGFEIIGSFEDHAGFDGVMLGRPDLSYHLEFTQQRGHVAGTAPNQENLLVLYLPITSQWQQAVDQMISHRYQPVKSYNPYWDVNGKTFEDADGYRVVLQNASWPGVSEPT
ncbi:MAG TPA: VOC family protein [Pyrinomonadaceae bacterium]|nr:VOC family protein [Pyrinomonadaceae bacterium]